MADDKKILPPVAQTPDTRTGYSGSWTPETQQEQNLSFMQDHVADYSGDSAIGKWRDQYPEYNHIPDEDVMKILYENDDYPNKGKIPFSDFAQIMYEENTKEDRSGFMGNVKSLSKGIVRGTYSMVDDVAKLGELIPSWLGASKETQDAIMQRSGLGVISKGAEGVEDWAKPNFEDKGFNPGSSRWWSGFVGSAIPTIAGYAGLSMVGAEGAVGSDAIAGASTKVASMLPKFFPDVMKGGEFLARVAGSSFNTGLGMSLQQAVQVHSQVYNQTGDLDQANTASQKAFAGNLGVNVALSAIMSGHLIKVNGGIPTEGVLKESATQTLKKMGIEGASGALLMSTQQVISNVATGRKWDEGISSSAVQGGIFGVGLAAYGSIRGNVFDKISNQKLADLDNRYVVRPKGEETGTGTSTPTGVQGSVSGSNPTPENGTGTVIPSELQPIIGSGENDQTEIKELEKFFVDADPDQKTQRTAKLYELGKNQGDDLTYLSNLRNWYADVRDEMGLKNNVNKVVSKLKKKDLTQDIVDNTAIQSGASNPFTAQEYDGRVKAIQNSDMSDESKTQAIKLLHDNYNTLSPFDKRLGELYDNFNVLQPAHRLVLQSYINSGARMMEMSPSEFITDRIKKVVGLPDGMSFDEFLSSRNADRNNVFAQLSTAIDKMGDKTTAGQLQNLVNNHSSDLDKYLYGLDEFFKDRDPNSKVTKSELLNHIQNYDSPVSTTMRSDTHPSAKDFDSWDGSAKWPQYVVIPKGGITREESSWMSNYEQNPSEQTPENKKKYSDLIQRAEKADADHNPQNYSEMLWSLKNVEGKTDDGFEYDGHPETQPYKSHAFPETPNNFGWTRFDTRTDENGKKVLYVNEMQKVGTQKSEEEFANKISDLPIFKNFNEFGLRQLIKYARENGIDKIALPTGEQIADLYPKNLDYYKAKSGGWYVKTDGHTGYLGFSDADLEKYVGQKNASRIRASEGETLNGTDSQKALEFNQNRDTGIKRINIGTAATELYDKILPKELEKLTGGKIKTETIAGNESKTLDLTEPTKKSPSFLAQDLNPQYAKAITEFDNDGKAILYAFGKSADLSSAVHELSHVIRRNLPTKYLSVIESHYGVVNGQWTRDNEELYARANERFIAEGKAPSKDLIPAFEAGKKFMVGLYGQIEGSDIDVKISDGMRSDLERLWSKQKLDEFKNTTKVESVVGIGNAVGGNRKVGSFDNLSAKDAQDKQDQLGSIGYKSTPIVNPDGTVTLMYYINPSDKVSDAIDLQSRENRDENIGIKGIRKLGGLYGYSQDATRLYAEQIKDRINRIDLANKGNEALQSEDVKNEQELIRQGGDQAREALQTNDKSKIRALFKNMTENGTPHEQVPTPTESAERINTDVEESGRTADVGVVAESPEEATESMSKKALKKGLLNSAELQYGRAQEALSTIIDPDFEWTPENIDKIAGLISKGKTGRGSFRPQDIDHEVKRNLLTEKLAISPDEARKVVLDYVAETTRRTGSKLSKDFVDRITEGSYNSNRAVVESPNEPKILSDGEEHTPTDEEQHAIDNDPSSMNINYADIQSAVDKINDQPLTKKERLDYANQIGLDDDQLSQFSDDDLRDMIGNRAEGSGLDRYLAQFASKKGFTEEERKTTTEQLDKIMRSMMPYKMYAEMKNANLDPESFIGNASKASMYMMPPQALARMSPVFSKVFYQIQESIQNGESLRSTMLRTTIWSNTKSRSKLNSPDMEKVMNKLIEGNKFQRDLPNPLENAPKIGDLGLEGKALEDEKARRDQVRSQWQDDKRKATGKVFSDAELQQDGFNPQQIADYKYFRSLADQLVELNKKTDRANGMSDDDVQKKYATSVGYFPMDRGSGKWSLQYNDPTAPDGKGFNRYEDYKLAKEDEDKLRAAGMLDPKDDTHQVHKTEDLVRRPKSMSVDALLDLMKDIGLTNDEISQDETARNLIKESLSRTYAGSHWIPRKFTGMQVHPDIMMDNLQSNIEKSINRMYKSRAKATLSDIFRQFPEGNIGQKWRNMAEEYTNYWMSGGLQRAPVLEMARKAIYVQALAGNVFNAFIHSTHPLVTTVPYLMDNNWGMNFGDVSKFFGKGVRTGQRFAFSDPTDKGSYSLPDDVKQQYPFIQNAFDELIRSQHLKPTSVAQQIADHGGVIDNVIAKSGFLTSFAEKSARATTAAMSYMAFHDHIIENAKNNPELATRLAGIVDLTDAQQNAILNEPLDTRSKVRQQMVDNIKTKLQDGTWNEMDRHQWATKFAGRSADEANFLYNQFNIPKYAYSSGWLSQPLRSAYMFKNFSANYFGFLVSSLKSGRFNYSQFATLALPLLALGGVGGIPFASDIKEGLKAAGAVDIDSKVREMFGNKTVSDLVLKGIPAALPSQVAFDMSRKVGAHGLLPEDLAPSVGSIGTNDFADHVQKTIGEFFVGAPEQWINNISDVTGNIKRGEWYSAGLKLLPVIAKNIIRATQVNSDGGLRTQTGKLKIPSENINAGQRILTGAGFKTTQESDYQDYQDAVRYNQSKYMNNEEYWNHEIAIASFKNDDTRVQELLEQAQIYNSNCEPGQEYVIKKNLSKIKAEVGRMTSTDYQEAHTNKYLRPKVNSLKQLYTEGK